MKLSYVGESEQDGAEFWLKRVRWKQSEVAEKIVEENDPKKTSYVFDIGWAHGRETLWLDEQGFLSILFEPNKYFLRLAKKRARDRLEQVRRFS